MVDPAGESRSHARIFIELAKEMGSKIEKPTEAEVKKAVHRKAELSFRPFEKKEGLDISPKDFIEAINKSVISGSRLVWLTMAVKEVSA